MVAFALQGEQRIGGDRFDFRYDEVRLFAFYDLPQLCAVKHVDHVRAVGNLHAGRIRVPVDRDGFHAEPLHRDYDLFPEFPRAAEQNLEGRGSQRRTDRIRHFLWILFIKKKMSELVFRGII